MKVESNFSEVEDLIEEQKAGKFCITLDWLSMYFKNLGLFG